MGEGAATIILEEYEHAIARNAKIYGEMIGYGATCDAYHITGPDPEATGAKKCMEMAVNDAGIKFTDVDYINAHGTSTPLNDKTETLAIKKAFKDHAYKLSVSSTKSMTGHECWMAGASEIAYSLLMMKNDFIAPNINFENPDEDSAKINVVPEYKEQKIDCFLSNSFGFGGTNSSLIVKKIVK